MCKKIILSLVAILVLSSCSFVERERKIHSEKDLISSSTEKVSLPVDDADSIEVIEDWLSRGKVKEAILACPDNIYGCVQVEDLLKSNNIPVRQDEFSEAFTVSLIYQKSYGQKCDPLDLGCSVYSNIISSVQDKKELVGK